MDTEIYLESLQADIEAFAGVIESGPPDARIVGCPGWTLVDLAHHLGGVHRWARHAVVHLGPPELAFDDDPPPTDHDQLVEWIRAGGQRLLEALRSVDPAAPTWHPFPAPMVAGVWPRRQAQENSVHRWDAQHAIGIDATIDAAMAADGIDEYFGVMLGRLVQREHLTVPASCFAVVTTDTGDRWVLDGGSGDIVVGEDVAPLASLSGTAQEVLLRLWGRPVHDGAVVIDGDHEIAAEWLALGGA